jgi:hypothetical protein
MIERFGLPARELWLVIVVVAVLTASLIGFAATMPTGDRAAEATTTETTPGINPVDTLFSTYPSKEMNP